MSPLKLICIFLYFAVYHVQADKYTDESRPYEFGFTIEGEQHRHEKKDENGIIMGEFGFITADGVYHVTVYATDENGNFKIISMKNIRVKPYPTAPTQNHRQGHSLTLPSPPETKTTVQTNNRAQQIIQDKNSGPAKTCSHCSVPTTTTLPPKLPSDTSTNRNNQQKENQYNTQIQSNVNSFNHEQNSQQHTQQNYVPKNVDSSYNQKPFTANSQSTIGQQYLNNKQDTQYLNNKQPSREINTPLTSSYPQSSGVGPNNPQLSGIDQTNSQTNPQTFENYPEIPYPDQQHQQQLPGSFPLNSNAGELYPQNQGQPGIAEVGKTSKSNAFNSDKYNPKTYNEDKNLLNDNKAKYGSDNIEPPNSINISRQPKSFNEILESVNPENEYSFDTQSNGSPQSSIGNVPKKPVLVAAQMQIVDKNTDIYHKNPGEKDGLPQGLTKDDMTQLLYTFNYTLGFHGHHEKGYTNGAKIGYYFVTGRNGIRMRVDYVADETGFHPRISQEVLDILSDDVPKPETEKDEKYGLKGYEFKWLYYPVDSS